MRRSLKAWTGAIVVATAFATASAGEVVRFVDGRYLAVESHAVEGTTLTLVVQRDAVLLMPVSRVEQIRRDDEVVFSRVPARAAETKTEVSEPLVALANPSRD